MSRRRVATWLLLAFALAAGGAGAAADALAAHRVYPARLLVYAQEWSLSPSRATLPAGRVVVQLWNRGMDPHDLRARRLVGGRMVGHTFAVHLTLPGRVSTATWRLGPGRYQLYCSLPGHMKAGMRVQITVRRRA
jgi:plastocyanin